MYISNLDGGYTVEKVNTQTLNFTAIKRGTSNTFISQGRWAKLSNFSVSLTEDSYLAVSTKLGFYEMPKYYDITIEDFWLVFKHKESLHVTFGEALNTLLFVTP